MNPFDDFLTRKNLYTFDRVWQIDAPLELIWNELMDYKGWHSWCDGLKRIEPQGRFDRLKQGNHIRSVWKGSLPYSIAFDAVISDFCRHSFLSFSVTGDLCGTGMCRFLSSRDHTFIHFIWKVSPTKLWMKISSPFARPVFIGNHDYILNRAALGFTRMVTKKAAASAAHLPAHHSCPPNGGYSPGSPHACR